MVNLSLLYSLPSVVMPNRFLSVLASKNISSHSLEFLWQPGKNQKKKVVFPERREGGTVVLPERSEGKTVPPERSEGKTFF